MTILRDHAIADDLRAYRQVVGQNDQHGLADRTRGDVARLGLLHEPVRRLAHLADAAGRRLQLQGEDGLNRVDDEQ